MKTIVKRSAPVILAITLFLGGAGCGKGIEVGNPNLEGKIYAITLAEGNYDYRATMQSGGMVDVEQLLKNEIVSLRGLRERIASTVETVTTTYTLVGRVAGFEADFANGDRIAVTITVNSSGGFVSGTIRVNDELVLATFTDLSPGDDSDSAVGGLSLFPSDFRSKAMGSPELPKKR